MNGIEFALDMNAGPGEALDFIDEVFAAADALYAANSPAAFGMALRFMSAPE